MGIVQAFGNRWLTVLALNFECFPTLRTSNKINLKLNIEIWAIYYDNFQFKRTNR